MMPSKIPEQLFFSILEENVLLLLSDRINWIQCFNSIKKFKFLFTPIYFRSIKSQSMRHLNEWLCKYRKQKTF